MGFDPETKPLDDAELEMVIGVIRRGLKDGDKIAYMEARLGSMAAAIKEAAKRLKEMNRIGQEIARSYTQAISPQRKQPITAAEAIEQTRWIQEKSDALKGQLE